MLPFISAVQKNLQLPVQVPMGFLTRPVTRYQAHHDSGNDEYTNDYEGSLHHTSVPFVWPRYSAIAIAEMNIPAMIQNRSISTIPVCRSSHPSVSSTTRQVLSVRPAVCSSSSLTSQCPYSQGYCYHVVCDDNQLYHTSI